MHGTNTRANTVKKTDLYFHWSLCACSKKKKTRKRRHVDGMSGKTAGNLFKKKKAPITITCPIPLPKIGRNVHWAIPFNDH